MPIARLLHNPKAGDKDHTEDKLVALIEGEGFECSYASVKEDGWKDIPDDADIVVIIGGDGTVRKVARELLNAATGHSAIGLLPFGTANNIAKTLNIQADVPAIVRSWHGKKIQLIDVGVISGLPGPNFFIEGFGFGVFPQLVHDIKKIDKKKLMDTPAKEVNFALQILHDIVLDYEPRYCRIVVDGVSHTGNFLLAEIMNIRSVGPNLELNPGADPGDGQLEVILVPEKQRRQFADHLLHIKNGTECPLYPYETLKGEEIKIKWDDVLLHADDELMELKEPAEVAIKIHAGALKFLVP